MPTAEVSPRAVIRLVPGAYLTHDPGGGDLIILPGGAERPLDAWQTKVIETFAAPRTIESGIDRIHRQDKAPTSGEALSAVMELLETGILQVFAETAIARRTARSLGMYGCPRLSFEESIAGDACHVAFMGMPYELGITGREGTRKGPDYLRRFSRAAFDYVERAGNPIGWWDTRRGCRRLEGVRFGDVGDISCSDTTRNGAAFDRLYDVVGTLLGAGRLPVIIGGDHSLSYPAISAVAKQHARFGIIHFDAHPDLGSSPGGSRWRRNLTHGNFMSWVEPMPQVAVLAQFGVRHLLPEPAYQSPKIRTFPGTEWTSRVEATIGQLPDDIPYYVTFDVDCLDPSVIAQTGTPVPGGLSYQAARDALCFIGERRDVVGLDVVELAAPRLEGDSREATNIAYLLFEFLASIFDRRGMTRAARTAKL